VNDASEGVVTRRVLVVDDSPTTRRLMEKHLVKGGCVVEFAVNGEEAMDMMMKQLYDVVFMDLLMPVMNGFCAAAEFRKWERAAVDSSKHQAICVVSCYSGKNELEMSVEVGIDFFETKPVNFPGLLKIVELCATEADEAASAESGQWGR